MAVQARWLKSSQHTIRRVPFGTIVGNVEYKVNTTSCVHFSRINDGGLFDQVDFASLRRIIPFSGFVRAGRPEGCPCTLETGWSMRK